MVVFGLWQIKHLLMDTFESAQLKRFFKQGREAIQDQRSSAVQPDALRKHRQRAASGHSISSPLARVAKCQNSSDLLLRAVVVFIEIGPTIARI
jgi:hypothetical protein